MHERTLIPMNVRTSNLRSFTSKRTGWPWHDCWNRSGRTPKRRGLCAVCCSPSVFRDRPWAWGGRLDRVSKHSARRLTFLRAVSARCRDCKWQLVCRMHWFGKGFPSCDWQVYDLRSMVTPLGQWYIGSRTGHSVFVRFLFGYLVLKKFNF